MKNIVQMDNVWCKNFISVLFFLFLLNAKGQEFTPSSDLKSVHTTFENLSEKDGLSSNAVSCIYKDSRGFIWIGTRNGLNRYNAYTFEVWKHMPGDTLSINNNEIFCINEDEEQNILIGSRGGLNTYSYASNQIYSIPFQKNDSSIFPNVRRIKMDMNKTIWIGTEEGLYKITEPGTPPEYIQKTDTIQSILSIETHPKSGLLWLGTFNQGLIQYSKVTGTGTQCKLEDDIMKQVHSLYYSNNMLFIGTQHSGAFLYNLTNDSVSRFLFGNKSHKYTSSVLKITGDRNNNIWVSSGHDVFKYSLKTRDYEVFTYQPNHTSGRSMGVVYDILCDNTSTVWLATGVSGIDIYNPNNRIFQKYYFQTGPPEDNKNYIKSLYIDSDEAIWTGTFGNGIKIFDKTLTQQKKLTKNNSFLPNNYITQIVPDSKGNLWIGTLFGVVCYNEKTDQEIKRFTTTGGLWHNTIVKLFEDSRKNIWIATQEGLNIYNPKSDKLSRFSTDDGLVHYKVNDILEDKHEDIWIATYNGISVYIPGEKRFRNIINTNDSKSGISDNMIYCLAEDNFGDIWIGTNNGLNRYNVRDDNFTWYFEKHGVICNIIHNIIKDHKGRLWILTPSGVSEYFPSANTFKNYNQFDGLYINPTAIHLNETGMILLGAMNSGLYAFHPDSLSGNTYIPPVCITHIGSLSGHYKPVFSDEKHKFVYTDRNIRIRFTALNYTAPENNRFAYKLTGWNNDYIYTSARNREAVYSNLSPGEYTFHVMASNNNDIWNKKGDKIGIEILPPWWLTWWAFLIYFTGFGSLFLFIIKIRHTKNKLLENIRLSQEQVKIQHEAHELKLKFFTNISHEFRTPLTLISVPIETVLAKKSLSADVFQKLQLAKRNIYRMQNLVNQLLDYRKISKKKMEVCLANVEIIGFLKSIYNIFTTYCSKKGIKYTFFAPIHEFYCRFDTDILDKILYNLISNAIKNAPKDGEVTITIQILDSDNMQAESQNKCLKITISNTGKGIAPENIDKIFDRFYQDQNAINPNIRGSGIGLSIVKEYVELLNGKIQVESEPNIITSFFLEFPVCSVSSTVVNKQQMEIETGFNDIDFDTDSQFEDATQPLPQESIQEGETDYDNIKRIMLIVEDNAELCQVIADLFSDDFRILKAENGSIGLKKATEAIPDIIISDIMMPVMDGIELCRQCKQDEVTAHIPIVLLTAKADKETEIAGYKTGADAYVSKPFSLKLLKTLITNIIDNREKLKKLYSENNFSHIDQFEVNKPDKRFINKVKELLDSNIQDENFSVTLLAQNLNMSNTQLHRKFSGILGVSPGDYIRSYKLSVAKDFLEKTDYTVEEIAYKIGFKHASNFSRAFQRQFNVFPSQYRKNSS
jgi:ligand-binding sensor domain-containing protein/signal transduction histidine kinase/DNA-binding response OmpR family regulator